MANITENTPPRHFILPVDDTPETIKAFKWLLARLYKQGDIIDIVRVIPDEKDFYGESGSLVSWVGVYEEFVHPELKLAEHVTKALKLIHDTFGSMLKDSGAQYRIHMLKGSKSSAGVADAIAEKAKELNVEAIVMAHHKKSLIQTWFHGSVCREIIQKSDMPLVVIS